MSVLGSSSDAIALHSELGGDVRRGLGLGTNISLLLTEAAHVKPFFPGAGSFWAWWAVYGHPSPSVSFERLSEPKGLAMWLCCGSSFANDEGVWPAISRQLPDLAEDFQLLLELDIPFCHGELHAGRKGVGGMGARKENGAEMSWGHWLPTTLMSASHDQQLSGGAISHTLGVLLGKGVFCKGARSVLGRKGFFVADVRQAEYRHDSNAHEERTGGDAA